MEPEIMERTYKIKDDILTVTAKADSTGSDAYAVDYLQFELTKENLLSLERLKELIRTEIYSLLELSHWTDSRCKLLSLEEDGVSFKEVKTERVNWWSLRLYLSGKVVLVVEIGGCTKVAWAALGSVKEMLQKLEEHQDGTIL